MKDKSKPRITRINVVGTSGSGKSTFGQKLATALVIPYIEMDALFWKPNWQESSNAEFFLKLEHAIAGRAWVLDGNYTRTLHQKWTRTQMVIWLDYALPIILWRAMNRAVSRSISKKELWLHTGNTESFRKTFFSRDSILLWTLTSYRRVRRRYTQYPANPAFAHIIFVRLRSPRCAKEFLRHVSAGERLEDIARFFGNPG